MSLTGWVQHRKPPALCVALTAFVCYAIGMTQRTATDELIEVDPATGKREGCRICERLIMPWASTGALRPHKMPREKHDQLWPNLPYLDGWCPGGRGGIGN